MPRIIVITGNGKGKTTSALGMVLRAVGHGMKVSIIQFIKNRSDTGEIAALSLLPKVEIVQCGMGFIPAKESDKYKHHCNAAADGLRLAIEKLADTSVDMIVLDEICGTLYHGLLSEHALLEAIKAAHDRAIIICTGRYAPDALIELADTVSVIESLKHGYELGIKAQEGVEL
jgi:cob(I)alamin adenosyltransferase